MTDDPNPSHCRPARLTGIAVRKVGPKHVAILTNEGKVYRLAIIPTLSQLANESANDGEKVPTVVTGAGGNSLPNQLSLSSCVAGTVQQTSG